MRITAQDGLSHQKKNVGYPMNHIQSATCSSQITEACSSSATPFVNSCCLLLPTISHHLCRPTVLSQFPLYRMPGDHLLRVPGRCVLQHYSSPADAGEAGAGGGTSGNCGGGATGAAGMLKFFLPGWSFLRL